MVTDRESCSSPRATSGRSGDYFSLSIQPEATYSRITGSILTGNVVVITTELSTVKTSTISPDDRFGHGGGFPKRFFVFFTIEESLVASEDSSQSHYNYEHAEKLGESGG